MHRLDWHDLQYVLAVAEHGSLAAAARALGVNHTTVLRRVGAFERAFGTRLFDRLPSGYALTASGEELAAAARRMDETVAAIERRLTGRDLRLTGGVRVATTDTLALSILPAHLAAFASRHPGVELELVVSNALANLTRRDADVAVRPSTESPAHLVGRRIARIAFAPYAAPSYLAASPARRELERHAWLAPDESLAGTSVARWMARRLPSARVALRANSLAALRDAAAAGLGVAALPCYLGDGVPALRRVRAPLPDLATELWVLTHEDLRGTARVRALTDFLATALARERDLIEGRRPGRHGAGA